MKLNMIRIGSGNASASIRSNGPLASTASSSSAAVARMRGSISFTRRGVNARAAGLRRRPCARRVEADHRRLRLVAAVEQRLADLGRERDQRQLRVGRAERLRVQEHALDVRVARDHVVVQRRRVEHRRARGRSRQRVAQERLAERIEPGVHRTAHDRAVCRSAAGRCERGHLGRVVSGRVVADACSHDAGRPDPEGLRGLPHRQPRRPRRHGRRLPGDRPDARPAVALKVLTEISRATRASGGGS